MPGLYDEGLLRGQVAALVGCRRDAARRWNIGESAFYKQLDAPPTNRLSVELLHKAVTDALLHADTAAARLRALAPYRTLAGLLGCTLVQLPRAATTCAPDSPLAALARAAAELGDVARTLEAAVADGQIDPPELARLTEDIQETLAALLAVQLAAAAGVPQAGQPEHGRVA